MTIKQDYIEILSAYIENGWITTPLPHAQKGAPFPGITGSLDNIKSLEKAAETSEKAWETYLAEAESTEAWPNLGARTPDGHISLDIDSYEGKDGIDTIRELEERLDCPLPSTYMNTRRGEPLKSAHWIYKVPADAKLPGDLGKTSGVEILKPGHRYSVAYPSIIANDKGEADQYTWYRLNDEGEVVECDIPDLTNNDIPELPQAWLDYLSTLHIDRGDRGELDLSEAIAWLEENTLEPYGEGMRYPEYQRGEGHEPWLGATLMYILNKAVKGGQRGAITTIKTVLDWYRNSDEMLSHRGTSPHAIAKIDREAKRNLTNNVAQVKAEVDRGEVVPAVHLSKGVADLIDSLAEEDEEVEEKTTLEEDRAAAVAAVEASAPEDYWKTQPVLAEIAHYASRASVDKYSLLFRVLTYLSAEMPPTTYLEDMGQPLTLYSAVIAESGAGKGVLDKVADALVGQHLHEGDKVLRPGTGNLHTLLTALGDFSRPQEDGSEELKPHRMLIQGNELAAWAEMQGNAEWAGAMADVFDGQGDYEVRNTANCYHFGVDQHSLAVTFSVQPDAAEYLFASTGRGLPGRFLISALPPQKKVLPEDFDPWDLDSDFEVDTFDPARDVEQLKINSRYFNETTPFRLSDDARRVNARLKRAWDEELGEYKRLRSEKIFSQMPKVKLRVAVLLTVLLDLGSGREVPLEALKMADFLLSVSVENTRYARALADTEARKGNAAVAAERKRADADADLSLAKENVLSVIDKAKSGRAGLGTMNQRKKKTADDHPAAIAELVAEGVLETVETDDGRVSYRRK